MYELMLYLCLFPKPSYLDPPRAANIIVTSMRYCGDSDAPIHTGLFSTRLDDCIRQANQHVDALQVSRGWHDLNFTFRCTPTQE